MHKEAGRPWPIICPEDDVLDYMVMEAIYLRARKEEEKAHKDAERKRKVEEERQRLKAQVR